VRGKNNEQQAMMFVVSMEEMVPGDHPIRAVKKLADAELAKLDSAFERMYGTTGRPSIPPERLLKASLLMALFSVRSERQLCEQLHYNFLYRWFLDMGVNEEPFDASVFAKNRERLMNEQIAQQFFDQIVGTARESSLLSNEHFTVDGTLIEANASIKSFKRKDRKDDDQPPSSRNETVDFHGEKRTNDTHESTTDAEARLYKKGPGKEARLSYSAHVLMENRNGLCVDIAVAQADGHAEVDEGIALARRIRGRGVGIKTLGADKGYDRPDFIQPLRAEGITPHVAAKVTCSALDCRTTRHTGYALSQRCRKKVEEIFGWMKTVGGLRRTRYRGRDRTGLCAYLVAAAYNLVRLSKLLAAA
jgi:transposase/IS5 family transposase